MATLTRRGRLLGFYAMSILAGCGDPQVGDTYGGEPLWRYEGELDPSAPGIDSLSNLRVALFFSKGELHALDPSLYVEHPGASQAVTVPSLYVLNVFEPPGPDLMLRKEDGGSAGYAMGRIFVYQDQNGDRLYTAGEQILGNEPDAAWLYAEAALPAESSPTAGALPSGLTQVRLPQLCGLKLPPPTDAGTCGVPLGNLCRSDRDCNGGTCLLRMPSPFHDGACTIA